MEWYYTKSELWCSRALREVQRDSEAAGEGTVHLQKKSYLGVSKTTGLVCSSGKKSSGITHSVLRNGIIKQRMRYWGKFRKVPWAAQSHWRDFFAWLSTYSQVVTVAILITTDLYTCEAFEVEMNNLGKWQRAWGANPRVWTQCGKAFWVTRTLIQESKKGKYIKIFFLSIWLCSVQPSPKRHFWVSII